MKLPFNLIITLLTLVFSLNVSAKGRIQNEDIKSLAEIKASVLTTTGNLTISNACITSPGSTTGLAVGHYIYDSTVSTRIAAGTTIAGLPGSCSAGQIQMSANAVASGTGDTLTFGGQASQLINDSKVYVGTNGINDTLANAISNGQLGGSSSVGGINLLSNESFEFGTTGYTTSGGTFSQQVYTNGKSGDTKYGRFVATGSGQYVESTAYVVPDSLGVGCQFDLDAQVTSGSWTYLLIDGSGNTTNSGTITVPDATSWTKQQTLSTACPAAGVTIKLRLLAGGAGTLNFDHLYAGGNKNVVAIAQARVAGSSYFPATASCQWSRTSTTIGAFATVAACPGPTILEGAIGSWQTTDSDLPRQTVNNLPPGKYKITAMFNISTNNDNGFTITDGTTSCRQAAGNVNTSQQWITISCIFNYTSSGNRSFELLGRSGSSAVLINNTTGVGFDKELQFLLEYYPSDSQSAVNYDQASWMIDVSIGGANPASTNVSSYTPWENASLDMVLNQGSATAQIPCSSTNPSTGLTCAAGNEQVGVVFTPPFAGFFDVCLWAGGLNSSSVSGATEWVETSNTSQTIIQEGNSRVGWSNSNTGDTIPVQNCGTFYFSSASQRTLRFAYEANATTATLAADRSSVLGQRDIHITVRPSTMNVSRPVVSNNNFGACQTSIIGAVTTAPTKGTTTRDCMEYYRDGKWMYLHFDYQQTSAGTAGSGYYLISLPDGLSVDTSYVTLNTATTDNNTIPHAVDSTCNGFTSASNSVSGGAAVFHTATQFKVTGIWGGGSYHAWGSAQNAMSQTTSNISCWMKIPISTWY